ncbi:MAG TPA: DinB family protein [Acidimicrobiales bacterium]|nr:DinB family protein [Acidimicrobiales bacterium]
MHDDVLASLAGVADALVALPGDAFERRPAPDEWSVAQVIGHLRAADAIWRPRILFALVHDGLPLPDVDERLLQTVLDDGGLDVAAQVLAYAFGRAELCGVLAAADGDAWSRTFVHSTFGAISVLDACQMVIGHEAEHLAQIRAAQ